MVMIPTIQSSLANERPAADAGTGVCLHIGPHRPGAAEAEC